MIKQELIFGLLSLFLGLIVFVLVFLNLNKMKALHSPYWRERLEVYKILAAGIAFLVLGLYLIFT